MANSDFIFKITPRESREEYSVTATSGTVLDEELCQKYPEDAIIKAKQLKAKHGTKYSDAYYLDMGKSIALQEIIGANREIHKKRIVDCPIKFIFLFQSSNKFIYLCTFFSITLLVFMYKVISNV